MLEMVINDKISYIPCSEEPTTQKGAAYEQHRKAI